MKNALMHIVMVVLAAYGCVSCDRDYSPENPVAPDDGRTVSLTFNMRMLGFGATRAEGELAERISSLRVVIVDLGIDDKGNRVANPSVERNMLLENIALSEGYTQELPAGIVRLQFPKIRADRRKKVYLLVNSEPTKQSYLDMRLADGTKISTFSMSDDFRMFLPDKNGTVPIEEATFVAPQGSYFNNDIPTNEEMLVPMTAFHTISIPSLDEIIETFPTMHRDPIYPLPSDLYVVRAMNKITFEFCNNTYSTAEDFEGVDLLIREWSLSEVNSSAYLFGHPGNNGDLFSDRTSDLRNQVNAPWMQWIKEEAEKSQSPEYKPYYQWLTEYAMPSNTTRRICTFRPGNYAGAASAGTPSDEDGYVLPAPDSNRETSLTTEDMPVYFGESHSGNPQQYELSFTVWQRTEEQKAAGKSWNNPHTYRAKSTISSPDNNFNLRSLFRNTHVVVKVTFRTGVGEVSPVVEVHPYGSYELDPTFGL